MYQGCLNKPLEIYGQKVCRLFLIIGNVRHSWRRRFKCFAAAFTFFSLRKEEVEHNSVGKFISLCYVKTGVGDLEAERLQLRNIWKAHKNATFLNWPRLPIYSYPLLLPSSIKTPVFCSCITGFWRIIYCR